MDALQAYICAVQLDADNVDAWLDLGLLYELVGTFPVRLLLTSSSSFSKTHSPEARSPRTALTPEQCPSPRRVLPLSTRVLVER